MRRVDRSWMCRNRSTPAVENNTRSEARRGNLLLRPHRESTTIFNLVRSMTSHSWDFFIANCRMKKSTGTVREGSEDPRQKERLINTGFS